MSDIVERLREKRGVLDNRWPGPTNMDLEAATEIERLREEIRAMLECARLNPREDGGSIYMQLAIIADKKIAALQLAPPPEQVGGQR